MRRLSIIAGLLAAVAPATAYAQQALPHFEASRRPDCGIDVDVALGALAPDLRGVAVLVVPHAAIATTTLDVPCSAGRVVAELPRAVLDAAPAGAELEVELTIAPPNVACGEEVGVLLCGRDRAGRLREGLHAWARDVGPVAFSGEERVATPSGDVPASGVPRGGVVLARDPSGAVVETRVRTVRETGGKAAVQLRLDDGRTIHVAGDMRFVVVGASAPRRARDLVAGDAIPTRGGGVVHVVAAPVANGYVVSRTATDVAWPDTYFWQGLAVADDGRAASQPPRTTPAPVAVPAEQASFRAARSWDCQVMGTVEVHALPAGARSVVLVAAPHPGPDGARVPLACASGTRVEEIPRAAIDAARAAIGTARFAVTLSGGPISCLADVAILPCAVDASGTLVALAPSALYARGGPACLMEGTPVATPTGDVPVEALAPGMELESFDVATGRPTRVRVQHVARRPDARVLAVEAEPGLVLRVTAEHLVWNVRAHRFVQAASLRAGDRVRGADGHEHRIVSTGVETERAAVYDVSVDGTHAYFAWGLLVHNY